MNPVAAATLLCCFPEGEGGKLPAPGSRRTADIYDALLIVAIALAAAMLVGYLTWNPLWGACTGLLVVVTTASLIFRRGRRPVCPHCGAYMVPREEGSGAGWVCPRYPQCQGVLEGAARQ